MTIDQHLAHLLKLLDPPFTENWRAYAWNRAKELAQQPDLQELPALLESAMRSRATPTPSTREAE